MTKQIELSKQGKNKGKYFAIVDDEDFERVNQFRWSIAKTWNGLNYAVRAGSGGKTIYMHRFILGIENSKLPIVDHINGNGLNNCKMNIRISNYAENANNRRNKLTRSTHYNVKS